MRELTLRVEADKQAPGVSRSRLNALRSQLEPRFRDVSVILSELVTNSVNHAGSVDEVRITVSVSDESIRVSVTDAGPCFEDLSSSEGGLGLRLVETIADAWGIDSHDGCTVWAELSKRASLRRI